MQPASGQGSPTEKSELIRHLDSIAWAAFFIWIGIAMFVVMPWGWFLGGLGILILAAQLARSQMNIKVEASGSLVGRFCSLADYGQFLI